MGKIIVVAILVLLSGCSLFQTRPEQEAPADRAVYRRYTITMPERPVLNVETLGSNSTVGQAVRAYELDLINVTEYALKLENIITPIATSEQALGVQPQAEEAAPVTEEKSWWGSLFSETQ